MADGTVKIGTEFDDSGARKGLEGLGGLAKKGFSAMGGVASAFAKTSVAAIGAVTGGMAAAGTAAIAVGKEFETSFAKASTLFGDVNVDTDNLKKNLLSVSDATGVAASELNESLYSALSAGIDVTEDMAGATEFLESSAKLAKAGFTDMDTAVSATAKTLNAYGLDISEAERIQRILIQTQNKGITTVDELGNSLSQVTPTASSFGVSFENVGAALSNMTAAGTPTAQATTQLNALIAELGKNGTQGAKSLAKATKGTKYAGMGFKEMMDAGVPLNEVLDMIQASADKSGLSMVDMFSSIEAGKAGLALSGENSAKFAANLEAMGTSADVVTEAYDKVSDTLETKVGKIQNSAKNLGISVYNGMQEPLKGLADMGIGYLDELAQAFQSKGIEGLVDVGAKAISDISLGIARGLPRLIGSAVSFIGTFVDSLNSNMPQLLEAGGQMLMALLNGMVQLIPSLAELCWNIVSEIVNALIENAPVMTEQGAFMLSQLADGFLSGTEKILSTGVQLVTALAGSISSALPQLLPVAVRAIVGFAQNIVNNLPSLIDAGLKMLQALAEGIANSLPTVIEMVPRLINSFADTVYSSLPKILEAGVKIILTLGKGIIDSIPTIIANAGEIIKAIINVISLANLVSLGKSLINTLVNGIKGMKTAIAEAGGNLMQTLVNKVKTTNWVDVGKNIIMGIVNGVKNNASKLVKAAAAAVEDALNWVKEKLGIHSPSRVFRDEVGKNIALGIADGILQNKDYVKKSTDEIAQLILDEAKKKLDNEKVYRDLSLADEAAYWDSVRKQVKEGTQARIDADKEYLTKKKSLNQKMQSIEADYTSKVKSAYESLEKSIQSLRDAYADELTSRTKDIMGSMDLFSEFSATTELSTQDLLNNLSSQVNGLRDWSNNLKNLERRGVGGDMLDELRGMGTDAAGEIALMAQMTDAELDEYISLWKEKQRLARKEAKRELEPMLDDTEEQIRLMREEASRQLAEYKAEFVSSMAEIGVAINDPLMKIQQTMMGIMSTAVQMAAGTISDEADKQGNINQFKALGESVLGASSTLPSDFISLGHDTVSGMIQGIQDKTGDLCAAMASVIRQAVQAAKDEAQIHSPSKLMRDMIGRNMVAGIGVGIELEADSLETDARKIIKGTVNSMQRESAKGFVAAMQLQSIRTAASVDSPDNYRGHGDGNGSSDGTPALVIKKGSFEVPVIIEGKEVARASAPYMDTELGTMADEKGRGG